MKRSIDELSRGTFDVLILGGGITGAGVALDAALRGYRVALIDKGDFAAGTSSASSKLVHGGLRYLEHGDFHLVYEALRERHRLLRNAPHLVQPLRFVIPFLRGARVPAWKWRLGLTLYDVLAGRGNIQRSRPLTPRALSREFPALKTDQLSGGAEYHDAQMDDARLCVAVLQTAALHGACVANYVEAMSFLEAGGQLVGARARDHVGGGELDIHARQILNAAGPWVDAVCRLAGAQGEAHLQPSKGVHLVVPARGWSSAFLLLHPRDGRVFFVIPWLGKTLIGTTDTFSDQPADGLTVLPEEIAYLLEGHNHYFAPSLNEGDVLGSFAGLRPLLKGRKGDPSSRSREFQLFWSANGLLTVAGGKYTTYRHMAEVITDAIARRLGGRSPCRTTDFPLDGAPTRPWPLFVAQETASLCQRYGLDSASARHLLERYGRRAADVTAYLEERPELAERIHADEPDMRVELLYQQEHEMALFPADHLLRRTRLGLFHPELLKAEAAPWLPSG